MRTGDAATSVRDWVTPLYPGAPVPDGDPAGCPVLDWAASGAMALTGHAGHPPLTSPAPSFGMLGLVMSLLAWATGRTGLAVRPDPAVLLTGRAGLLGLTRHGQVSAGGSTRLLRAADGWCAVTLSRPDDAASVPAIVGRAEAGDPWAALAAAARAGRAEDLAARAQLLGVPAAALPRPAARADTAPGSTGPASAAPWTVSRIAAPAPAGRLAGAVVVDLSSMWAGPLCARLLGLAGAQVIKVESPSRPDGARAGHPRFFDWLHAGHRSVVLDFRSPSGRSALAALLRSADVVIEASRPRALAQIGLAPDVPGRRAGQVWLSITGYGRGVPDRVAFGDDAAVAGGLVGWDRGEPVFCADAVADPLAGICGALAVSCSVAAGGGHLIDLSMRATAAAFASAPGSCGGRHRMRPGATVECLRQGRAQPVRPPRVPELTAPAAAPGADTVGVLTQLASC